MFCGKCGNQLNDGAAFCNKCGNPVAPQQPVVPQQPVAPQQPYAAPQQPYAVPQQPYAAPQQPYYAAPQQPYYAAPQQPCAPAPITQRNIALCIVLSIITCGIYGIVWLVSMANDLNVAARKPSDTSGGMVFLLSIITCGIYMYYWLYKAGEKVSDAKRYATGMVGDKNNGVLYLVLAIFGLSIVSYCLIQNELNQVAAYK